jgi:anaerobic ribonucleoside-triphosphate reductase
MKNIKKITSVIAISLAFLTANVMGGVTVQANTINTNVINYNKLLRYLKYEQPAQIKRDMNKIIKSYKKQNKTYSRNDLPDSEMNQLYSRFKVNKYKLTSGQRFSVEWAAKIIEVYLLANLSWGAAGPSESTLKGVLSTFGHVCFARCK